MATPRTSPVVHAESARLDDSATFWPEGGYRLSPAWIILGASLLYTTGLLIVFTFLGTYGLHETDVLRIKYLYVGILFGAFPAAVCTSVILLFDLYEQHRIPLKEEPVQHSIEEQLSAGHPMSLADEVIGAAIESAPHSDNSLRRNLVGDGAPQQQLAQMVERPRAVSTPAILLALNFVAAFYLLISFAPPQFFLEHNFWSFIVLCATLFGLFVPRAIQRTLKSETVAKTAEALRWALLVIALAADLMLFQQADFMADVVMSPAWVFLLCVLVLAYLASRILIADQKVVRERQEAQVIHLCLFGVAYFIAAICFAYTAYPYIPASRGGGDFTASKSVVLYFKPELKNIPTTLLPTPISVSPQVQTKRGQSSANAQLPKQPAPEPAPLLISKKLIVIDETAKVLLVADPLEAGGPSAWRLRDKPKVHAIRRDDLTAVEYQN
ncbi:MAG TPA: hypothetical protein VF786_12220 [Terriglobales bacterium]